MNLLTDSNLSSTSSIEILQRSCADVSIFSFVSLIGIHADMGIAAVRTCQLHFRTLYIHESAVVFVLFPGVHTSDVPSQGY